MAWNYIQPYIEVDMKVNKEVNIKIIRQKYLWNLYSHNKKFVSGGGCTVIIELFSTAPMFNEPKYIQFLIKNKGLYLNALSF